MIKERTIGLSVIVDIGAIRSNIQKIRQKTGKKILLMIKAEAYGHGTLGLVHKLQDAVDAFGVADTEEGAKLIECGCKKPILITCDYENPVSIVKYGFTPFVFTKAQIAELSKAADLYNRTIKVHIKAESGMGRFGTQNAEMSKALAIIIANTNRVRLTGIATHYSSGDKENVIRQNAIFREHIFEVERVSGRLLRHSASTLAALNTGGIYDMLRIGIGAYGYGGGLTPAMKIVSRIIAINRLGEGACAGYDNIYCAEAAKDIAIISGGYADGISRSYVGGYVSIRATAHRIVAVCMDSFIVELSRPCRLGDEVEILYPDNSAQDLAKHSLTIPYEILTSFKGRIKRIYNDTESE
ncbi:MAG: alanine racemase [Clostridia bacterium]|nr:alanine racemase [Clostridia bacterium]